MSLFSSIAEFFEMLFFGSNPESMKKRALRKMEKEIKAFSPPLMKNRALTPAFAEALIILHKNCQNLREVLKETLMNSTNNVSVAYIDLLLSTGFSRDICLTLNSLRYEVRKETIKEAESEKREIDRERALLEKSLKDMLNSGQMEQIEQIIAKLIQLYDICSYDFERFIQAFAPDYGIAATDKPVLRAAEMGDHEQKLMDLYYVITDFSASVSMGKAFCLLAEQHKARELSEAEKNAYIGSLTKISGVLTSVITPELLFKMICLSKRDPGFQPTTYKYTHDYVQECVNRYRQSFDADTQRIISELKDERLKEDLISVFSDKEIVKLKGYNNENNEKLQRACTQMFMWTTPLALLKSFLTYFLTPGILSLLNDIVVEGLFSNTKTQSSFSSAVFHCSGIMERITKFENSFDLSKENDFSSIMRLASNSKNNPDLSKQLMKKVTGLNIDVKNMLQQDMSSIKSLCRELNEILVDAKKGSPEIITNVKQLFSALRNKEHVSTLDKQIPYWTKFIELMKNYVLFTDKE